MTSDALFISSSHGFAGGILANNQSYILGKGGSNSWPNYYLRNMSSSDIADLKLFMAIACNSADTSSAHGNLLDEARAKGTDIAIGWHGMIMNPMSSIFGMGFCRAVWDPEAADPNPRIDYPLGFNHSHPDAMQYAYGYMWDRTTNYSVAWRETLKNWQVKGMYGHRLKPARYGEW